MKLEVTAELPAPPDHAWAVATDWERQAAWMPDVAWMRVLGAERELGARVEVRTRVLGVPLVTDLIVVTAWEPPHRMLVDHRGMVAGWAEWRLEPAGEDRSQFLWQEELRMRPPFLGELALRVYGPVQRWMLRRSVRNLVRLVAASASG
jgi:carbon monoxide dehydrogenase subunit G